LDLGANLQIKKRESGRRAVQLLLMLAATLYLYVNLFTLPGTAFYLEGDQTWFRANALRMLHGERIYQDFFQFTPPGTDLFYLVLLKLFGFHTWVMNAAVLLVGVALCCICFSVAKLLVKRRLALLAAALFLVLIYSRFLDATHHFFSLLAVMCAVRIVMPCVSVARIAFAGALLGIASFFTQTTGVVGAIALLLFFLWEGRSTGKSWRIIFNYQLTLIMAFGLTLSVLGAYFLIQDGWRQLWYFLGVYSNQFVAYGDHRFLPRIPRLVVGRSLLDLAEYLLVYALLLVIYPTVLWHCFRKRRTSTFREIAQPVLLSLVGLSLLLEMITRVNRIRLYSISMTAIILLIWALARVGRLRGYVATAGWVIVACLAIQQTRSTYCHNSQIAELPSGKTALPVERYEQFSWLMQHTKPGDYFFQSSWPNVYFPLDLRSPVFVDGLGTNEVTRPEWVGLTVQQLEEKQVKYILCSPWLYKQFDPSRPWEDHLGPFRDYLRSHYTRVRVFSDQDEIWERR
jgi:4-amino-4-deoxy-L-arabinose transferase-like glycosyltransferase